MAEVVEMHNYYEILGVNEDASIRDIRKAYREKALSDHPDKGGDDQRMSLLNTAYQTLMDPIERGNFDRDWKDFNAAFVTEASPSVLLDPLPAAGSAFSKTFRQQHVQYVKQCYQAPLDQKQASSYLKCFHSDLYCSSGGVGHDLFSFIKTKRNFETKLDIGSLTPEKAVEYFINFLQGDYSRDTSKVLSRSFYQKLKQLQTSEEHAGSEFKLYSGIYEILLVAVKEKIPSANILFSLHKITEYAKQNVDQAMRFISALFQRKYFRSLFSQALHYYWLSEESVLDESYAKAFNGEAAAKRLFESLKSKLCENRRARKSNDGVAKLLRYVRLLYKLEQDLNKSADISTADTAAFYREKAFHLLDWVPSLLEFAGIEIAVNTLLQIGIALQRAAVQEEDPVLRMADEKLATQICVVAVATGRRGKPDIELYACVHSVKCLLSCRYADSKFKEVLEALQRRTLWLADMFPFVQMPKSNADFMAQEDKTLELMRQLLHALIDKICGEGHPEESGVIDHSYARVLYQAYEACLKNWYDKNLDPKRENEFRQRLMNELLTYKQWTSDDINYNLRASWPLNDIDEEGWTFPGSQIAKKENITTYRSVRGARFNYKTGKIDFILDYCKNDESDLNRLLTLFDLSELFQGRLTEAIFSLDPVDPDMPYHPFNQMRFAPSRMQHSNLLHAMFLADYLLKFFTVGQEVRRCDPYELRLLDRFTSELPDYLKKVIYDFHASSHEESLSRFWIESEEVELAIDDDELKESGDVLFALGNTRMVVKHRKMERDAEGNLVDREGADEGWDCYVLTQEQEQELYNNERVIEDSALIIIKESWDLLFWENNKATCRFTLEEDKRDLISLSCRDRDSQEKIKIDDSESLRQIYRIVLKAAKKTKMPHRYSPEFIFAQEFTKYYDDFAVYFPEFGRLRELSKAVSLVNVMAAQREANREEVSLIRRRLNYKQFCNSSVKKPWQVKEYNYWQTTRQELKKLVRKVVKKQFEEWRKKFSKEKIEEKRKEMLNDIRCQIGTLQFTRYSPEIRDICDRLYDAIKADIIAEHGYSGWNSVSHKVYAEAIEPKVPRFIADLRAQKKASCHKQLLELFEDEFRELSRSEASDLIDKFLESNSRPLVEHLVYYDRKQVAKQIRDVFPGHTLDTLDKVLNNSFSIEKIVDSETEKAVKEHEKQLKELLSGREKLEQTYTDLGFGDNGGEMNREDTCWWVPASFRHDVAEGNTRTVYGGVCVSGRARKVSDRRREKALIRETRGTYEKTQRNSVSVRALCKHFGIPVDKLKKEFMNPKLLSALERQTTVRGRTAVKNNLVGKTTEKLCVTFLQKLLSSNPRFRVSSKENCTFSTEHGLRKLDLVIEKRDQNGKFETLVGFEIKTGNSPYVRPQSGEQQKTPTKQGVQDHWKERQKGGFPIILVRFQEGSKHDDDNCKIQ